MLKQGVVTISTIAPGGIRTVVQNYIESKVFNNMRMVWLHSHTDSNVLVNLSIFLKSLMLIVFYRLNGYKLFHIHMAMKGSFFRKMIIIFLVKILRGKTILHLHGSEFEKFYINSPALVKSLIKKTFETSDLVITLSDSWNQFVKSMSTEINCQTIFNYVEPIRIEEQKLPPPQNEILFMGAIGERKGIYDLLTAISQLPDNIKQNILLKVCGDGDLTKAKKLVHQLNIEEYVEFLGWTSGEQKVSLLNNCTVAVLPSYNEGLPMFILEAMSLGKPIISTTVGGIPEAIEHGKSGLLIEPGCVVGLVNALVDIQNPTLQKKLGHEGLVNYKTHFSPQAVIPKLKKVINDLSS